MIPIGGEIAETGREMTSPVARLRGPRTSLFRQPRNRKHNRRDAGAGWRVDADDRRDDGDQQRGDAARGKNAATSGDFGSQRGEIASTAREIAPHTRELPVRDGSVTIAALGRASKWRR